jgi:mannose-1-phosphate guanylyltransferase
MRWGVLLAGGSGTRFWPLSTPEHPKQLLPLAGPRSTAEEAMDRLEGLIPRERVLLGTGPGLAGRLQERLQLPPENVLVGPRAASTGPALVWASHEAQRRDADAEVLSMHADWVIGDADAFRRTAVTALTCAREHDRLVTVGVVPTRPDTGFGYIVPGAPLGNGARNVARFTEKPDAATGYGYIIPGEDLQNEVREVARFVEKPDAATALDLMAAGALWNSGLFAWTAARLFAEAAQHTPEIAPHLGALDRGDVAGFFRDVTPISIDVGLLERSRSVAVVSGAFAWDDVGTWDALARVRAKDPADNVVVGNAYLHNAKDCVVWAGSDPVVLAGVKDLIVVHANGRILIMPREQSGELQKLLK